MALINPSNAEATFVQSTQTQRAFDLGAKYSNKCFQKTKKILRKSYFYSEINLS